MRAWVSAMLAAVALTGCSTAHAAARCPVTLPGGTAPEGFNYGSRSLAVLLWPKGRLVAGRRPDGSITAEIRPDGSIEAKLGWWHGVRGRLRISGKRLDASAPPLRADVPDGYPPTGFQPSGLTFPTTGCWRVRGSVGRARLTFVVRVQKLRTRQWRRSGRRLAPAPGVRDHGCVVDSVKVSALL